MSRVSLSGWTAAVITFACVLRAQVPGAAKDAQLPDAATILDRYVEVTGGLANYRKYSFEQEQAIVGPENGFHSEMTASRARDGRTELAVDAGPASKRTGVTRGVAWELSKVSGARILTGRAAERALAESRGFDEDDWRERFPEAIVKGEEVINSKKCYHVMLTRPDHVTVERFYDEQSGLLLREVNSDPEEALTIDVDEYAVAQGIRYASIMRLTMAGREIPLKVESMKYSAAVPEGALLMPDEVRQALTTAGKKDGSLPNPVDLMEKFIAATGGKAAYAKVKTQGMKGQMTFERAGLKADLVMHSAPGGKQYVSFDLAGAGKFEMGSDGTTAWERSVMMGPRIVPKSEAGGLFGPDPDQILSWTSTFDKVETVSKDTVDGTPCYTVRMTKGPQTSTACFAVDAGYLVRLSTVVQSQMGEMPVDFRFGDYRQEGPIKAAHHLGTTIAGQPVSIDVSELVINGPQPDGIFDLPEDVRALKEKRKADADAKGEAFSPPRLQRAK